MEQEPHAKYNNDSVGNVFRINSWYWEHISPNRIGSGNWFLQSGTGWRKREEGRIIQDATIGWMRERSDVAREGFTIKLMGFRTSNLKIWHLSILNSLSGRHRPYIREVYLLINFYWFSSRQSFIPGLSAENSEGQSENDFSSPTNHNQKFCLFTPTVRYTSPLLR